MSTMKAVPQLFAVSLKNREGSGDGQANVDVSACRV